MELNVFQYVPLLLWILAGLGAVLDSFLIVFPSWTTRMLSRFSELIRRLTIEAVQIGSGVPGVLAAFAPPADKPEWFEAALAGFTSFATWKLAQVVIDFRLKAEAERGRQSSEGLTRLSAGIHSSVARKLKRVQGEITSGMKQPTITVVREALTPAPQLDDLLEELAGVLQRHLARPGSNPNVRAGVYLARAGRMEPVHGISLRYQSYNPFGSFRDHPDFFRLSPPLSHVARCVDEQKTLIVADCVRAEKGRGFAFAKSSQKVYLRSLVAYDMGEVYDQSGLMTSAAVSVDSDQPGLFQESDRVFLEQVLREFALRIRLELALIALIERRGTSHDA